MRFLIYSGALLFLIEKLAYADNCGSLSDCYGTIQSATGVGVGIAVMVMTGILMDFFRGEGETEAASRPETKPTLPLDFSPFQPSEGLATYAAPEKQFAQPKVFDALREIGEKWQEAGHGDPIEVGDMSYEDGRPMPAGKDRTGKELFHSAHREGVDVDIRPGRKAGTIGPILDYKTSPNYDRENTQAIVDIIQSRPDVETILFNDKQIEGVKPWSGHNNHLHVRFKK